MKLAIISDLHLTAKGDQGIATPTLTESIDALKMLLDSHDRLIVAGDLFDVDLGKYLFDRRKNLEEARKVWAPFLKLLERENVDVILGNHDQLLEHDGLCAHIELGTLNNKVLVLHGHQLKRLWRVRERVKAPVKWVAGRLSKTPLAPLGHAAFTMNTQMDKIGGNSKGPHGALALLRSRQALSMVVTGHTHKPGVWETPYGLLANSGAWSFGRFDALSIRLDTKDSSRVTLSDVTLLDLTT